MVGDGWTQGQAEGASGASAAGGDILKGPLLPVASNEKELNASQLIPYNVLIEGPLMVRAATHITTIGLSVRHWYACGHTSVAGLMLLGPLSDRRPQGVIGHQPQVRQGDVGER